MNKVNIIKDIVSSYYDITVDELESRSKKQNYATARSLAYYLLHMHTPMSMKDIGKRLGNRDHSTVVTMKKKAMYMYKNDIVTLQKILNEKLNNYYERKN